MNFGKMELLIINREKFATVKRMMKRGKSSLADIAEDTDLPLATVQQIQAEMQTA